MKASLSLLVCLGLSEALTSCAVFPEARTYAPVIVEVTDAAQMQRDLTQCHAAADNYAPGVSAGRVAQRAAAGAASNAGGAALSPLVPVAGAAGGVAVALIDGYDLTGQSGIRILVRCLEEKSRRDQSFLIADPN